ncbi:MAG: ribonuclease HI [Chthonomonadales bacterium]|nr:ribonuclease HI [Chthonomonadales bacterium]
MKSAQRSSRPGRDDFAQPGDDTVTIYTDGACLGNPGPGGYAAIVQSSEGTQEFAEGFRKTTNNRMEMMAALAGLRALKQPSRVRLYSDSQYLVNGMKLGWARRWQRNGWRRNAREPALNPDLWEELLRLDNHHTIEWVWVRGHVGDPLNERCDRLAVECAKKHAAKVDTVYEGQAHRALFD